MTAANGLHSSSPLAQRRHRTAVWAGALMWAPQPAFAICVIFTASHALAGYSFLDNTISDLGATTCTVIIYPAEAVPVCSPWHALLNGAFVASGVLLATGALLLARWLPRGRMSSVATTLWVLSGLAAIGTGLIPLNYNPTLHAAVSLPVFFTLPLAVLATAAALNSRHPRLARLAQIASIVALTGTISYIISLGQGYLVGLFERLALWPIYLWLPLLAITALRTAPQAKTLHRTTQSELRPVA